MKPHFLSLARSGVIALGIVAGFAAPSMTAPLGMGVNPGAGQSPIENALADSSSKGLSAIPVAHRGNWEGRGRYGNRRHYRRNWDDDGWRNRRHYRRNWDDDGWRYRRNWRPRYGSSIYFNFGVPSYRYVEPRYYAPRRVYRSGVSGGHVQWCYNRYRSYRAYDNSFQPYNGPRQQCWSPYM